jgi:hypothetical protein
MAKTNRNVIERALKMLGVTPMHQSPEGEDYEVAKAHLDHVLHALDTEHRVGLDIVSDNIPDWALIPLAKMVAGSSSLEFQRPQFEVLYNRGLRSIRAYAAMENRVDGAPISVTYY